MLIRGVGRKPKHTARGNSPAMLKGVKNNSWRIKMIHIHK